jgi:hypothetical protein
MNFEREFWPWYLSMHRDPRTRALHAAATLVNAACLVAAFVLQSPAVAVAGPLLDHLVAQASHRAFEQNKTRPWRHPLHHARAELRLLALVMRHVGSRWRPPSRRQAAEDCAAPGGRTHRSRAW